MSILEEIKNKERPFQVPKGYFSTVEDSVRGAISTPERVSNPLLSTLKSGFALAFSFVLIFGFGYGVMTLTGTMANNAFSSESDEFATLIESGYIRHDFVDYLYDEIEMELEEESIYEDELLLSDEVSRKIERELSEEELIKFLEEYHYE